MLRVTRIIFKIAVDTNNTEPDQDLDTDTDTDTDTNVWNDADDDVVWMSSVNDFASTDDEINDEFVADGDQLNAVDDETTLESSEANEMNMCDEDDPPCNQEAKWILSKWKKQERWRRSQYGFLCFN